MAQAQADPPPKITVLDAPKSWQEANNLTEGRLRRVDDRLRAIEARLSQAEHGLDRLDAANFDRSQNDHRVALLRPGEQGYSTLDTGIGRITVAITGVRPMGTGTRITLQLGNPTTANLASMRALILWGEGDGLNEAAIAEARSTNFRPATGVPASSWRSFDIDLPGLLPAKLGWVRMSNLFVDSISLAKPAPTP